MAHGCISWRQVRAARELQTAKSNGRGSTDVFYKIGLVRAGHLPHCFTRDYKHLLEAISSGTLKEYKNRGWKDVKISKVQSVLCSLASHTTLYRGSHEYETNSSQRIIHNHDIPHEKRLYFTKMVCESKNPHNLTTKWSCCFKRKSLRRSRKTVNRNTNSCCYGLD